MPNGDAADPEPRSPGKATLAALALAQGQSIRATAKSLVLRAGVNRSYAGYPKGDPKETTYTRDEWLRASQRAMSGFGARGGSSFSGPRGLRARGDCSPGADVPNSLDLRLHRPGNCS